MDESFLVAIGLIITGIGLILLRHWLAQNRLRKARKARLARMVWKPSVAMERMERGQGRISSYTVYMRLTFALTEDGNVREEVEIPPLVFTLLWAGDKKGNVYYLYADQEGILRSAVYNRGVGTAWTEGCVREFLDTVEKAVDASLKQHDASMESYAAARARGQNA